LPERFELVGVARSEQAHEDFRTAVRESVERFSRRKPDADVLEGLTKDVRYIPGSFDDSEVYVELERTLSELDERAGHALNRVFYLSTAPNFFPLIGGKLAAAGLQGGVSAIDRAASAKCRSAMAARSRQAAGSAG